MTDSTSSTNECFFRANHKDLDGNTFRVLEVDGHEGVSEPFAFRILAESRDTGGLPVDTLRELFGCHSTLAFGPGGSREVHGVVRSVQVVPTGRAEKCSYELVLVPRFWRTQLTRKSRVFTKMSIPDIVASIFEKDYQWKDKKQFEFILDGTYEEREYVCQYEETDFDFVSRWLEHLGIFYYFGHDSGADKIFFADSMAKSEVLSDCDTLTYANVKGNRGPGCLSDLRWEAKQRPHKVHLRDYDWRQPAVVYGDETVSEHGTGIQCEFGAHFHDDAEGKKLASVRAAEWNTKAEFYEGQTSTSEIRPGCYFSLQGGPLPEFDIKYFVTRVQHRVLANDTSDGRGSSYDNTFRAIDFNVHYCPERTTPWPRVGAFYARIDGAGGSTAAPIDEQGRYTVQLPFDVHPGGTGSATRWIRMAQASAGPGYGMSFPLHVGTEVIVVCVNQDPDRPLILGATPNPSNETYVGSDRATRSAIRTRSGIVLDFDDDAFT